jgi:hypothetical protein
MVAAPGLRDVALFATSILLAGCGSTAPIQAIDASVDSSASNTDASSISSGRDSAPSATACVPGQSVACVGPGGCATNQVCAHDGSGFGPCNCASSADAGRPLCVPGASIACAGPGGCISSQVCNAEGNGYGSCACSGDGGGELSCIPGQSIACSGPYGCPSYQVCNASGSAYELCACPDGGFLAGDGGELPDGYAPLPPPVGDQGYNAIWASALDQNVPQGVTQAIFLPLFSAPDCTVVPPYGDAYLVVFQPGGAGPTGTFSACSPMPPGPTPCYSPEIFDTPGVADFESVPGGALTLSPFNAAGIATGQMNTTEGIVPLVVKNCF